MAIKNKIKKDEKMSTYPVLVFGTGMSGDVILVLAVFNTSRHASTDNRNRINRKCFHFFIYRHLPVSLLL